MPHAPDDTTPRRKRPPPPRTRVPAHDTPPPPPRRTPPPPPPPRTRAPVHDTPPAAPPPTYSAGPLSTPTNTLDQVLAYGLGPLDLPAGKINLPSRLGVHHDPIPQLVPPPIQPVFGERQPPAPYVSMFGQHGRTVVPPSTQAYLEHQLGNPHHADAANYLLSAPTYQDLHQRAQELGVFPGDGGLGNIVHAIDQALGDPTDRISGFPETGRTALPDPVRRTLLNRIHHIEQQTGLTANLGPHPTDAEIVKASFVSPHHDSYWNALKNLPRDVVETPLYAFQGGYALGHAANRAAQGDFDPLREIGAQQVDMLRHPGATIQQHPFQVLLAASGLAKGVGGVTARARGLAEEPRVVPTRFGSTIDRGVSPANDYIRGVQGVQDYLTRPHATRAGQALDPLANLLQDSGIRKNLRQADRMARSRQALADKPFVDRVEQARGRLTRRQQERVLSHEAMGFTPAQLAHMRGEPDPGLAPLTAAEEEYRQALEDYRRHSEASMTSAGLLGESARLHREADPLAQVRAASGDAVAQRALEVDAEIRDLKHQLESTPHGPEYTRSLQARLAELRSLRDRIVGSHEADAAARAAEIGRIDEHLRLYRSLNQDDPVVRLEISRLEDARQVILEAHTRMRLRSARGEVTQRIQDLKQQIAAPPPHAALEGQISQAFTERDQALRDMLAQHAAEGGVPPIRVPINEANRRQGFFTRSTGSPAGVAARGKRLYTGALFASGVFEQPTHAQMIRDIRAPLNAQRYHRLANYILDPENGIAVPAEAGASIPEDMVLVKPAQRVPPNTTLETVRPGESIFRRLDATASQVPAGEGYALVPRIVAEEIQQRGEQIGKGKPFGKLSQGLRNVLLYSRGISYAATNLVGQVQQGLFENVGPLSYARGLRHDLSAPPGVEEGGAVRTNFSDYGAAIRDAVAGQNPVHAAAAVLGHPIAAYTQSMRGLAQAVEDVTRRGMYFKLAVPAARKLAHPDAGPVKRFAMSMRGADAATRRVLDQMASGEGDAAVQLAAKNALQTVDRLLGDYASLPSHWAVDVALPFHRWAQFSSRLLAVTLPLHYPGKTLILYRLGALGQQAQNQLGPLTPSLQGIIPVGNNPQDILALNTSYPNTFATLGEALAPDPRGGSDVAGVNPSGAASYLSPIARLTQALITGIDPTTGFSYQSPRGENIIAHPDPQHPRDPNATEDYARLIIGQALSTVPPLRLAFQPINAADTSIPLPGLTQTRHQPKPPPGYFGGQKPETQLPLTDQQRLFNFLSPFRVRRINLDALARSGVLRTMEGLAATQRKELR